MSDDSNTPITFADGSHIKAICPCAECVALRTPEPKPPRFDNRQLHLLMARGVLNFARWSIATARHTEPNDHTDLAKRLTQADREFGQLEALLLEAAYPGWADGPEAP